MKPLTWIRLFLFCVSAGQFRVVEARNLCATLQEKVDSLLNPPLMKQAEQILRFDKTVMDIGVLTEDDAPKAFRFMCTNVSGRTVQLARVNTTCGCTVAEVCTGEILSGESKEIVLIYNPANHPGTIDTNAFVYLSSSDTAPVARLTLIGNVLPTADKWARYPYAMDKLRLKQKRVEFREVGSALRSGYCAAIVEMFHCACRYPAFRSLRLSVPNRK